MKPVYLCGFMGCGKSHIGRLLAKKLSATFIDLDRYIMDSEKMTITEIFQQKGEEYFRELEASYIRNFSGRKIIATGGGALLRDETAQFAKESGTVFFIDVSFETCYERIKDNPKRPLVMKNTKKQLREIYEKRYPIYKKNGGCMIDGERTDTEIADDIIDILKRKGRI